MANLKDFFRDLLNWEKQRSYQPELRDVVVPAFDSAIVEAGQQLVITIVK